MGQKKITELTLRSDVSSDLNFPSDDGIQSYRVTAAQLLAFIFPNDSVVTAKILDQAVTLAKLKNDILSGLTTVSAADDDYFPLVDTSDSSKTKKALISTFARNLYRAVSNPSSEAITTSDGTLKISGTSGTVVLPTAVGADGKRYKLIHAGTSFSQVYTINTTSSQTVGGIASGSYKLITNGEVLEIESDGANWVILNHRAQTEWTDGGSITLTAITTNPTKPSGLLIDKVWYRRDGRDLVARYEYAQNGTTGVNVGSGDYLFALPASLVADTSYITLHGGSSVGTSPLPAKNTIGNATAILSTATGSGFAVLYDSTHFRIGFTGPADGGVAGSAIRTLNNTSTSYTASIRVPIVDWQP